MRKIGVLSDTHGFIHPSIYQHFQDRDEIWHAGDFGDLKTADELALFKQLRGVHGNCDGPELRFDYPRHLFFPIEGVTVLMLHICGYPGHYEHGVVELIKEYKPDLLVGGHSHILKVQRDKKYGLLHINPGAAGNTGPHKVKTLLRFQVDSGQIGEMDIVELGEKNPLDNQWLKH